MQLLQSKSSSDAQSTRAYGRLSGNSLPESSKGDDEYDGQSTCVEFIHAQRAAACCLATYYNVLDTAALFKVHEVQNLRFRDVYLSPLPQPHEEGVKQNVLIAVAVDGEEISVYIAFRGNSNLAEVFSDVSDPSQFSVFRKSPIGCGLSEDMGSYHINFCNRLSEQVPRLDGLLEFCRSLVLNIALETSVNLDPRDKTASTHFSAGFRTRLIFCGHSLGGGVSHLAAVAYLLSIFHDTGDVLKHQSEEDCMSITFGAPFVFDKKAASFLQTEFPVHNRFINFFQAKDPVPFILARAPISHQLLEDFELLKIKNATSLTIAGRFLVDRKIGKFLEKQSKTGVKPSERGSGQGKRKKAKKSEKGNSGSIAVPLDGNEVANEAAEPVGNEVTGAGVNLEGGVKKSKIGRKVSVGLQSVAVVGKQFIRRVTHGSKKAKINMESKRQMSSLESDVKKAKLVPGGDQSSANTFVPYGVFQKVVFDHKTHSHIIKQLKPEQVLEHDCKMRKNYLKQHKIVSYFHCLVGQGVLKKLDHGRQANIREGPLPQVDRAQLILIRCETSEKLKGARIIAKGKFLSLALEHKCQVTTFSDKWRLVAADSTSIIFETLRATDGKNVYVSQGELIELARVGHGNRATSVSVETVFGRSPGEFCPVLLRDLAADSSVIDGLKHSVGKVLVLLNTDPPKGGEPGRKILHHLVKAADITGLRESFRAIVQPTKGTVHAKKLMIDKGFIAQMSYALCYKPITLTFDHEGSKVIQQAAQAVRQEPFSFFSNSRHDNQLLTNPLVQALDFRTTALKSSDGQLAIELDSYYQILSCLHALVLPDEHISTQMQDSDEYASLIKTYESNLHEAMKTFYEGEVLNREKLKEKWFPGLDERSCDALRERLELLHYLASAFQAAKQQKLLALIGPENVGKSTLANILGCKGKESTGFMVHTTDMKCYRLQPDLLAVDFPGTDAPSSRESLSSIWEAFAKLPDRCIIVTAFSGDVTAGCQLLPQLAAETLCPDVMLLVNRVDGILKGAPNAKVWKQYSKETIESLQEKLKKANMAGVNLEEIVFCSLEEEDLHDSDVAQLKDRGIIFSQEVKRRVLLWVRGSDTFSDATEQTADQESNRKSTVRGNYSYAISTEAETKFSSRPTSHRARFYAEKMKAEAADRGGNLRPQPKARPIVGVNDCKPRVSDATTSRVTSSSKPTRIPWDKSRPSSNDKGLDISSDRSKIDNQVNSKNTEGFPEPSDSAGSGSGSSMHWLNEAFRDPQDTVATLRGSESTSATQETLRSDEFGNFDPVVRDVLDGASTSATSSSSTSTSTTGSITSRQSKGQSQFAHQLSHRVVITSDQWPESATSKQQLLKTQSNKKPANGSLAMNPAWKP